ncbi:MAG: hypothetical protein LQ352_001837 [Teloschistes flavicans]|nr:MAG: hypothetical protein LQ352_001837 [Teloschistes flavicans]
MPPMKFSSRAVKCPRCTFRANYATSHSRNPRPPLISPTRSRLSKARQNNLRQAAQTPASSQIDVPKSQTEQEKKPSISDALKETKDEDNSLLSPVHIPEDPNGVLNERHPAASILMNSGIVIQRQLELMNVFVGFEQANKYVILDPQGNHIGFIAEQDNSMGRTMARQFTGTHRSFTTHVFDKHEKEVLRFHRPFSWISSRIGVYDPIDVATGSASPSRAVISSTPGSLMAQSNGTPTQISPLALSDMRIIGEAQQQWAPLRRKYNLFLSHQPPNTEEDMGTSQIVSAELPPSSSKQLQVAQASSPGTAGDYNQFASVDEPFLSWDFSLRSADSQLIGSVNRNWGGFGRELFTDTGVYALRMDAAGMTQEQRQLPGEPAQTKELTAYNDEKGLGMTLDQRAVMLATAVTIDFDYFSRHSGAGGGMGFWPMWFPMGGGEAAAAGEAAEEGSIIRGGESSTGMGATSEGAAVGAGSAAGYEAMQGARGGGGAVDDASPTAGSGGWPEQGSPGQASSGQEDIWGTGSDPWDDGKSGGGQEGGGDGGGDGDGGAGVADFLSSFFEE